MSASEWEKHRSLKSDDETRLTVVRFSENAAFVTDTISDPFHGEYTLFWYRNGWWL